MNEDLYLRLESLSKSLESSGLIDEHRTPGAYATILDAMNAVLAAPATQANVQPKHTAASEIGVACLERLMKTSALLGISTAPSIEGFGADIENRLFAICRATEAALKFAAAQAPAPAHQASMVTVPAEPTQEMLAAEVETDAFIGIDDARRLYKAMLAAAPNQAPAVTPEPKPLTKAQVEKALLAASWPFPLPARNFDAHQFARAIERAHRIGVSDVPVQGIQP